MAGDAFRRGMGAVRGREGVVHVDIPQFREGGGEGGVVLLLTRMETGVFQQDNLVLAHLGDGCLGQIADAFGDEGDFLGGEDGLEGGDELAQAHLGDDLALGPVEVGQQHGAAALGQDIKNRRDDLFDAGFKLLLLFRDPLDPKPGEPNETNLLRLCDVHNIPVATNIATAEALIHSLERGDLDWRDIVNPKN